jgi:hypothetical protein
MAIDRAFSGGRENPKALRSTVPLLQRLVREEHVLIRAFARRRLEILIAAGEYAVDDPVQLEAVNRSELQEEVYSVWSEPVDDDELSPRRSKQTKRSSTSASTYRPYWFGPLGRAFGLSEKSVERA